MEYELEDRLDVSNLLRQFDTNGLEKFYERIADFEETPVDIDTFIDAGKFLGEYFDGRFLAEKDNYWRKFLKEIYPESHHPSYSPYWLCCLKGSVGAGKTTTACAGIVYDSYRLQCLANPQEVLGILTTDKIEFAIFNVTLTLAINIVWDKISQMFSSSSYFRTLMETHRKRRREDTLFPKRIDFYSGSRVGHSLGHSVLEVIIDEANFEVITGQVRKNFYSLLRRMQTRFIEKGGGTLGRIWIVSSETDKSSVLNQLIDQYRGKPGVIVRQPSLWDVKPERYGGKKFKVYKGSDLKPPVIVDETNEKEYIDEEENIIEVPEEHKSDFEISVSDALRDFAGISTGSRYRLFKMKDKLTQAMCVDLLFPEVFELDFHDDTDQITSKILIPEYFDNIAYPQYPRYLHIDIATSGDKLGLACSYIYQYREMQKRSIATFDMITEVVPEIVTEFAFGIGAKGGNPIPLFKVRSFILWLSQKGFIFGMISSDLASSMAADMLQMLNKLGFATQDVSVDRTSLPYIKFRSNVYEELVYLPANKLLRREMENLELSPDGSKVDHPEKLPDGTFGSKDVSDACCGSLYSAIRNSDLYKMLYLKEVPEIESAKTQIRETFWPQGINTGRVEI